MQKRQLSPGFEHEYANLLVGVDTLVGGDIGRPEGGAHFIADCYPKAEVELPPAYRDGRAVAMRKTHGAAADQARMVRSYIKDHGLLDTDGRLTEALSADEDPLRVQFARNMERSLNVIARTALALVEGTALPSFEERYETVTGQSPELVDTAPIREELKEALSVVGITVEGRDLRDAVSEWSNERIGVVSAEDFATKVRETNAALLAMTRERLFANIDFSDLGVGSHLAGVAFNGFTFRTVSNVRYTGSSAYEGGTNPDGSAALRGLIEYNTDHPVTELGMWHLIGHEMTPGHYVDSSIADLGFRAGRLGIEAVAHTMSTAEVVMREGWAQNTLDVLFGSEEAVLARFGLDQRVQSAIERLQDAAKNNSSIIFQMMGRPIDEVKRHVQDDCVLPDHIVDKMSGGLAKHPIIGPMYGPAYNVGYHVVHEAIRRHGALEVAKVALHRRGYMDIHTFKQALGMA